MAQVTETPVAVAEQAAAAVQETEETTAPLQNDGVQVRADSCGPPMTDSPAPTGGKAVSAAGNVESRRAEAKEIKCRLFLDDSVASFFRRPAWSPDGTFVLLPCGQIPVSPADATAKSDSAAIKPTTFILSRWALSAPCAHLPGPSKPVIATRFCPILFELLEGAEGATAPSWSELPYRVVWAVATLDAVLVYDSQHQQVGPLRPWMRLSCRHRPRRRCGSGYGCGCRLGVVAICRCGRDLSVCGSSLNGSLSKNPQPPSPRICIADPHHPVSLYHGITNATLPPRRSLCSWRRTFISLPSPISRGCPLPTASSSPRWTATARSSSCSRSVRSALPCPKTSGPSVCYPKRRRPRQWPQ